MTSAGDTAIAPDAAPTAAMAPARSASAVRSRFREVVLRYGASVALALAAVLPRVPLQPLLGEQGRFPLPMLAVALSAIFLGPGPALVTLAVATSATLYLVIPGIVSLEDSTGLLLYLATSGVIILLAARLRRAYAGSRASEAEATSRAKQLDAILRSMPDQVLVHDRAGRLIAANAPARASAPGARLDLEPVLRRYGLAALPLAGPVEARDAGVDGRWVEVTATEALDGDASILVVSDVTDRRRDAERQAALAAMFSHELRTPLTIIAGNAALLRSRQLAPEVAAGLLEDIDDEAGRMKGLIDDLVVLARGASAEIGVPEPVLIRPVLEEAARAEAARFGVSVDVTIPPDLPLVAADRDGLGHVIRSLLGNAAKYAPGRPILVRAEVEGDDTVAILVQDEGPGIAPGEEEAIFRLFYRSPSVRMTSGSGVGLFVSRALVEGFGGRITARNRPERGAEFRVRLPRYVDEDGAAPD